MINLLIIAPHFRMGGSQRVIVNLINELDDNKFNIDVLAIRFDGKLLKQIKNEEANLITTKADRTLKSIPEIRKHFKKDKYDVVFTLKSYLGVAVWVSSIFARGSASIIYREVIHKTASKMDANDNIRSKLNRIATKNMYQNVEQIVAPSKGIKSDLMSNYSVPEKNICIINNPVDVDNISRLKDEEVEHHWFEEKEPVITTMGRLTEQKGFDKLIRSLRVVKDNGYNAKLILMGKGELKSDLIEIAKKFDIYNDIDFIGFQENPYKYISKSDMFVMSSNFEGFPNSLLEAMACEVPVISTRCPSGPDEIINDYQNGLLVQVGDYEAIAEKIIEVIKNPELASALPENAKKEITNSYSTTKIISDYEKLIGKIANRS